MHVYRDTASIHDAHTKALGSELGELLGRRIEELVEYEDHDLSELVHILVIEPSDAPMQIDAQLGFSLSARPPDVVESHANWYEMTIVVSDDGFGWLVFVPKHPDTDTELLALCAQHCKEPMP